jgi:oligopeptide/dipeptide ABC transporter ATP-binding protein
VLIAMAFACKTDLIIADEPTTALDVTTQAQVIDLLVSLVDQMNNSLVVVTHNLGLVTRYANRIYVMYAGKFVESGTTEDIITNPKHPYTVGLLNSVPKITEERSRELIPIEGSPPSLIDLPDRCSFLPRCPYATEECEESPYPELKLVAENDHCCACYNVLDSRRTK